MYTLITDNIYIRIIFFYKYNIQIEQITDNNNTLRKILSFHVDLVVYGLFKVRIPNCRQYYMEGPEERATARAGSLPGQMLYNQLQVMSQFFLYHLLALIMQYTHDLPPDTYKGFQMSLLDTYHTFSLEFYIVSFISIHCGSVTKHVVNEASNRQHFGCRVQHHPCFPRPQSLNL